MARTTVDAVIPAPRELVYKLFTERDGLNAYLPLNITLKKPGAGAPSGLGAQYVVGFGGVGVTEETILLEPNERFQYKIVKGVPVKSHIGTVTFADAPGGTLVSYTMESYPKIPIPTRATELILKGLISPFLSAARKATQQ